MLYNEHISDELLAAWLDDNTTTEENELVNKVAQYSVEYRNVIGIARASLEYAYGHAYAASSINSNVLCCIQSEKFILNKKGIEVSEESLIEIAMKNNWFNPKRGTPPIHIGKLLEWHGLSVDKKYANSITDLKEKLTAGHFVIAHIDGGELTGDLMLEMIVDVEIGEIPDHVVVVVDIDLIDSQTVKIHDFSSGNEYDTYPIEQFMDSWADSKFYMISVE